MFSKRIYEKAVLFLIKNKRIKGVIFLNPKVLILDVVRNLQSFAPFLVDSELSAYKGNLLEVPQRLLA